MGVFSLEDEVISDANQITRIGMTKFIQTKPISLQNSSDIFCAVNHEIDESKNTINPAKNGLRSKINDFRLSLKRNLSRIVTISNNKNIIIAISHTL